LEDFVRHSRVLASPVGLRYCSGHCPINATAPACVSRTQVVSPEIVSQQPLASGRNHWEIEADNDRQGSGAKWRSLIGYADG
jgi:hypothetical protein